VSRYCWLASYPKSGNTWFRMVVANLLAEGDEPVDINMLPERAEIATARQPFDNILLVDSELLTHAEVDRMRPMLHRFLAAESDDDFADPQYRCEAVDRIDPRAPLVKTHDGYTKTDRGEPLLGGAQAARGAILVVRDPRDVAPSLANHMAIDIDAAISFMADGASSFFGSVNSVSNQLRQQLLGWSAWHASWLEQGDLPVHLVRYEDMKADPVASLAAALAFAGQSIDTVALARAVDLARFDRLQAREAQTGFREAPIGRQFFRRGESGGWRGELTSERVARNVRDHSAMMERLGYDPGNGRGSGSKAGEKDAVPTNRLLAGSSGE
jgi:aryl sulfotransferase